MISITCGARRGYCRGFSRLCRGIFLPCPAPIEGRADVNTQFDFTKGPVRLGVNVTQRLADETLARKFRSLVVLGFEFRIAFSRLRPVKRGKVHRRPSPWNVTNYVDRIPNCSLSRSTARSTSKAASGAPSAFAMYRAWSRKRMRIRACFSAVLSVCMMVSSTHQTAENDSATFVLCFSTIEGVRAVYWPLITAGSRSFLGNPNRIGCLLGCWSPSCSALWWFVVPGLLPGVIIQGTGGH